MLRTDEGYSVGAAVSVGTGDGINEGILDGYIESEPWSPPFGSYVPFCSSDSILGLGDAEGKIAIEGERLGLADGVIEDDDSILGWRCRWAVP